MTQTCPTCREPLPPRASTGRPRVYCSARCRDDAYRERLAQSATWERFDSSEPPIESETIRRLTAEAMAEALVTGREADAEARLAQAILESRNLAYHFKKIAREIRPDLSPRADRMGDSILSALRRLFTTEENS